MPFPGAAPLVPSSPVGQLRSLLGDTAYTPLDPDVPGQGSYAVFSDVALEAALVLAKDSISRAAGNLTMSMALQYAAEGKSIKTDDLAIDVKGRGADLLAVAKAFLAEADAADTADGGEFFDVVPFTPALDGRQPSHFPW